MMGSPNNHNGGLQIKCTKLTGGIKSTQWFFLFFSRVPLLWRIFHIFLEVASMSTSLVNPPPDKRKFISLKEFSFGSKFGIQDLATCKFGASTLSLGGTVETVVLSSIELLSRAFLTKRHPWERWCGGIQDGYPGHVLILQVDSLGYVGRVPDL